MLQPQTLSNGMRVHLIPFAGTEAATVLVLTKVGSRYEPDAVWGGSHFIEHLMFKGTQKRPTTLDISKTLDRFGAQYNAYTGKDVTGYWVKIDGNEVATAVDLLHDMIFHSKYDPEEMEREKKVIVEEIKMYEENPVMHLEDILEDAMFAGSTLGRNIAGTADSVLGMKRDDVIAYRDTYYAPSEVVIVIAGKVPASAMELLEATFGTVAQKEKPKAFDAFGGITARPMRIGRQSKDVQQIQFSLAYPTVGKGHADSAVLKVLANILGGAMSSRLFTEVRERRGLCYHISAKADSYEDVGAFTVRSGLDATRLKEATETIFTELKKVKTDGVTAEELAYAKDNLEGAWKLALEDSSDRAEFFGHQEILLGKVKTLDERVADLRAVTLEDVKRVANEVIDNQKLTVAAIGPYESDDALLNQITVVE